MSPALSRAVPWGLGAAIAGLLGVSVVVGANLAAGRDVVPTPGPRSSPGTEVSSDDARAALCVRPPLAEPVPREDDPLPPVVATVVEQAQQVRDLRFQRPARPESITRDQMGRRIARALERSYPREMMDRRTLAWRTIGVIGPDDDVYRSVLGLASSAIIGFYDTATGELVYVGSDAPTPFERSTLLHELTHALQDQHFDLGRLDGFEDVCAEDRLLAAVAVAEGDARLAEVTYVSTVLTEEEYAEYVQESVQGTPPSGDIALFVLELFVFPYPEGQEFITGLHQSGGYEAVNRAFRQLPASTEQIMHPDRYPSDEPVDVDVPDLGARIGGGWRDLDVYDAGEGWLRTALELRLDSGTARRAADGWDGGEYRAWVRRGEAAVALQTVWDSEDEAAEFTDAMSVWLSETATGARTRIDRAGTEVTVLWAPDGPSLRELHRALRG